MSKAIAGAQEEQQLTQTGTGRLPEETGLSFYLFACLEHNFDSSGDRDNGF